MSHDGKIAGRCATHDDLAWLYDDGSIGCMWELIVEARTGECRWVPMPYVWTNPKSRVVHLVNPSRLSTSWSWCGKVEAGRCKATSIDDTTCQLCRKSYKAAVARV